MAENSAIEWCDHTFNPWEGCQKVGPGCDHCYAEARNARFGGGVAANWGPGAPRRRTSAANWRKPLKWNADAERFAAEHGRRQRVFCASLADVFDNAVDPAWRADLAQLIRATPNLDWLLLTKRIGNVPAMLWAMFGADLPTNFRIGATVIDQDEWNRDASKLAQVAVLIGKGRMFLSMEPLLGPVDLSGNAHYRWAGIVGWVIVGGESGSGARPMHPDWARALRDQCADAGVPFLFKQWGEWGPDDGPGPDRDRMGMLLDRVMDGAGPCAVLVDGAWQTFRDGFEPPIELCTGHGEFVYRLGKRQNGRLLDGVQHNGLAA